LHFKGRILLVESDDEEIVFDGKEEVDGALEVTATELLVETPPFVAVAGVSTVEDWGLKDTGELVGNPLEVGDDVGSSVETP